jgi:two-component system OmpR family sensor kinase
MGRLFWKILLGFWVTLIIMEVVVGIAVYLHNNPNQDSSDLATGRRTEFRIGVFAKMLEFGGEEGVKSLMRDWPGTNKPVVLIVDAAGRDIFERKVPESTLNRARAALRNTPQPSPNLRSVKLANGNEYILFIPAADAADNNPNQFATTEYIQIGIAFLASFLFSLAFAWYLGRPVHHLRQASRRLAEGALDTRVTPHLGNRRDEIADLGQDFDYMAAHLQTLMNAQKQLLHDVSHELRSPLARLRLAIGLFQQQPDKFNLTLERIEREVERLDQLLGEILHLSRLEADIKTTQKENVDLKELLDQIVHDANFEAQSKDCQVNLQMEGEITLNGYIELLHRAFENVIRNAVKYADNKTTVDVVLTSDQTHIVLQVCDSGPGVPEGNLESIFLPFYRITNDASSVNGFGLGLAIAYRAVKAHGGLITAYNRPEGGLCVEIKLPL